MHINKNDMKQKSSRKGFTLIEMLIVIAIIGILSSIVLVGLGPVQRRGRDARRQSDLRGAQNALELYYNKCGRYPGDENCGDTKPANWDKLSDIIGHSNIGVPKLPNDPSAASEKNYYYGVSDDGSSYVIGATLEDLNNQVFNDSPSGNIHEVDCGKPIYCIEF
jgi:prepilin-type N-terminal cleavage/methylation domain-containing protein